MPPACRTKRMRARLTAIAARQPTKGTRNILVCSQGLSLPIPGARSQATAVPSATLSTPRRRDPWPSLVVVTNTPQHREAPSLERAERRSTTSVHRGSRSYPELLGTIADPPDVLYVQGLLTSLPCVAVVGSRACSACGRTVATRLARDLARSGIAVVSGLARGFDAAAHRGCLDAGGVTIAVLPGGLCPVYPQQHRGLARRIAASGTLIAEHEPGTSVARWHFPKRNRIIAALSWATVVVEAAARSGARITANMALDYGREVLIVPGPITSATSAGCHALLADGAHPCTSAADILDHLPPTITAELEPMTKPSPGAELDAPACALLDVLRRQGTLEASEVAGQLGWTLVETLATITRLELGGLVRNLRGNRIEAC